MKVSTPSISWHNRERISSIDFQGAPWPNDKHLRLASGGDDKHVVIWDWKDSTLSCLADLNRHQNSVNTLRWSKSGKVLASGDTDSAIYLWHFQDIPFAPDLFGDELPEDEDPGENWSVWKILRGHLQDVVSLDWSSCGNYIISSSTDNTAIVFDVNKGTKLKILGEHKGWVNGVGFDPLGKFVASICSDRFLRVYSTKSYKTVSKTNKCKLPIPGEGGSLEERGVRLFHDDTFQSFYRRLEFSPDGMLLMVPSGVLEIEQDPSISHCTYIFSRTNFAKPVMYLPNKEFSIAVRFCPLLFELRPIPADSKNSSAGEDPKPWEKYKSLFALPYRMIYAVATQNTVMFYDTQQSTPFARVSKIHYIGLTDLSWSPDGHTCIVSSTDGYASFVEFQKGELGQVYVPKKTSSGGLEEISSNVPIKPLKEGQSPLPSKVPEKTPKAPSTENSPFTKAPSSENKSTPTASLISFRKAPKEQNEVEKIKKSESPLPKQKKEDKKPMPAAFISFRKAPKTTSSSCDAAKTNESVKNSPSDSSGVNGESKAGDNIPNNESVKKSPSSEVNCENSSKDEAARRLQSSSSEVSSESNASDSTPNHNLVQKSCSDDKSEPTDKKSPSSEVNSESKASTPPKNVEVVKTPQMSSSSGILTPPPQARKRVELVTLSLPDEDIEMAEEEETEEDEPLLLEEEEESPLKNP